MEKIALLFPGQGAHFVGMGQSIYEQHELARHTFEEASDVLGMDLAKLCFEGSLGDLTRADNAQPALITVSVAFFRVFMKEFGVIPQFCAGHSLGEYSALTCAGSLRFPDALRIVRLRGEMAEEISAQGAGSMTVVEGVDRDVLEAECERASTNGQLVAISCYNAPHQYDISGHQDAVMQVEERILEHGGQVTPLIGSAPIHSPLMEEAAQRLKEELARYNVGHPRYPVVANVTARLYSGGEAAKDNMVAHMVRPVQWQATMEYLKKKGVTLTIEMGAKNVLTTLTKLNEPTMKSLCFGIREDRQTLSDLFSRPEYRKHAPTVVTKCLAAGAATPNRNWNNDEYTEGVIKPYRRIQEIQALLDSEGRAPSIEEMQESLRLLRGILATKQVPEVEQAEWFEQIFDETGTRYMFKEFTLAAAKA